MSGIKIESCIKNFISDFKDFSQNGSTEKPELIKFDSILEEIFYELTPAPIRSKQIWKDVILQQSYPVLQRLWDITFDKIKEKIELIRKESKNKVIFINLHTSYYHNRTQEYVSLINLTKLSSIKPTIIVTLIDDVYEIHHRLTKSGGIYHDESNVTHTQMILRLLRLLDWRAKETMLSRFIANNLNIKNYVFAVNHSYKTFYNLIFEDINKVYLSHPITEVRRLEKRGLNNDAQKIMSEITEISDRLSSIFTTFLPTTIDEFRVISKPSRDGISKDYYAVLNKRWEADLYERSKDKLFIHSGFNDKNNLWQISEDEVTRFDEHINHLLEALSDSISDQVTIRDYTLVEQSEMLVIYRPVFNGNASGGVREEFRYYKSLIKDTAKKNLCFIYCPQKDINKYYIRQFEIKLQLEIEENETLLCKSDKFDTLSTEESEQLLHSSENELLLLDTFDKVLDNHNIEILVRNEKTPLGENKIKDFKNKFVLELLKSYRSIDMYKTDVTYFEDNEIPIEHFCINIREFVTK